MGRRSTPPTTTAIWQFKTTADLADSTSGTLVGLNDLRTLGVPYDGQNSAVAVVDTGVDASVAFVPRPGRAGTDIFTGGLGNQDLAPRREPARRPAATAAAAAAPAAPAAAATVLANTIDGHGTPVAGVIAQFVPQATIVPVNIFVPFIAGCQLTASSTAPAAAVAAAAAAARRRHRRFDQPLGNRQRPDLDPICSTTACNTSIQHPFVNDPLRPGKVDRVIAASFAFGTTQTFQSEVGRLQELPADRDRAQERLPQVPQGRDRADRGRPANSALRWERGSLIDGSDDRRHQRQRRHSTGDNNADNSAVGDSNGMSLPAVLNEVISVTGVYSFPYDQTPASPPTDQVDGVIPNPLGPDPALRQFARRSAGRPRSGSSGSGRHRRHGGDDAATGFNANAQSARGGRFRDLRQSDPGRASTAATRPTSRPRRSMSRRSGASSSSTTTSATTTGTGDDRDRTTSRSPRSARRCRRRS